jgi:hypothetical protein
MNIYGNKEQLMPFKVTLVSSLFFGEIARNALYYTTAQISGNLLSCRLGKHQARPRLLAHIANHFSKNIYFMRIGNIQTLLTVQIINRNISGDDVSVQFYGSNIKL